MLLAPVSSHFPSLSSTSLTSHKWIVPFQVLICRWVGLCLSSDPVGLSNELSYEAKVFPTATTPTDFLKPGNLCLLFPTLEPCVQWCVLLLCCSFWLICTRRWDHLLGLSIPASPTCILQLPCPASSPPPPPVSACPTIWMNVSLTPWLLDFHANVFLAVLVVLCF